MAVVAVMVGARGSCLSWPGLTTQTWVSQEPNSVPAGQLLCCQPPAHACLESCWDWWAGWGLLELLGCRITLAAGSVSIRTRNGTCSPIILPL